MRPHRFSVEPTDRVVDESPGWLFSHMPPDTHSEIRLGLKHARRETESTNAHAHVLAWVREFNATYGYGACPDRSFLNGLIGVLFAARTLTERMHRDGGYQPAEMDTLDDALDAPVLAPLFIDVGSVER